MANGEQVTGTRDEHYNLVSTLYHALQAGETSQQYIRDAEQAGNNDLASFFRDVQEEDRRRAERAKDLLKKNLG